MTQSDQSCKLMVARSRIKDIRKSLNICPVRVLVLPIFDKINKLNNPYLNLCQTTVDKQFNTGDKTALSNLVI